MAKQGFDYYSVDTDRYQDIRIKRLKRYNGCDGIAVYDYILSEIYRDKGYFIVWGADSAFDVAEYFGIKETKVRGIVEFCASVGLFDKVLLGSGVLTSAAIQRRYIEMCTRARRRPAAIIPQYNLLDNAEGTHDNAAESDVSTEETPKNAEEIAETPQICNKVKYSKPHTAPSAPTRESIMQSCPYVRELSTNQQWIEIICMQYSLHPPDVQEWLYKFALDMQCAGKSHWTLMDTQSHFNSWLRIQVNKQQQKSSSQHERRSRTNIAAGEVKDYNTSF